MPVVISPSTTYGRELWQWDHTTAEIHPDDEDKPSHEQLRGKRSTTFQEYPKMLYQARKNRSGQISVGEVPPNATFYIGTAAEFERDCLTVESFNRGCQRIVKSADEHKKATRDGWSDSPLKAIEKAEGLEQDIAQAAAEAAYAARGMSEKARAELTQADASTYQHVTDVQGIPKSRRGVTEKAEAIVADPASN